jgi:hypothetical protein
MEKRAQRRRPGRFMERLKLTLLSLMRVPGFLKDPKIAHTYFPAEARKSRTRILTDNILWAIRNAEVNESYFVYGLDRKAGVDHGNYIGSREGMALIRGSNAQAWTGLRGTDYRCLCKDKFLFGEYLTALSFPTPRNLAFYDGSQVLWVGRELAGGLDSILDLDGLDVICKDAIGAHGRDVFSLKVQKGRLLLGGVDSTVDDLKKMIPVPALLQERLIQHPAVAEIYPHSINTFRLVTMLKDGKVTPFRGFMRFGANRSLIDNWAAGGVAVGMDLETGRLCGRGVFRPGRGDFATAHPETGFRFEGFEMPFFREAMDLATRLHGFFYGLVTIGWDIAITPGGPAFIEGNHSWEIWPIQAILGGLKAELRKAIPPRS